MDNEVNLNDYDIFRLYCDHYESVIVQFVWDKPRHNRFNIILILDEDIPYFKHFNTEEDIIQYKSNCAISSNQLLSLFERFHTERYVISTIAPFNSRNEVIIGNLTEEKSLKLINKLKLRYFNYLLK